MNINNPIILGHSYGGRIGIVYASKYNVDKLVLVSSAGIKEKLTKRKQFKIKVYKFFKKHHINLNLNCFLLVNFSFIPAEETNTNLSTLYLEA